MDFHIKLASFLAELLDNKFNIFGFRFGLDPILGFLPGFGDVITLSLSLYLVWIAKKVEVPSDKMRQIVGNIFTDVLIGMIPFVGDVSDFVYKANSKNLAIIKKHIDTRPPIIHGEILQ